MPSTVADVLAAAGATPAGVVPWGSPPAPPAATGATRTGIYIVALSDELESTEAALSAAPISAAAVDELLTERKELTLDRHRPTEEQLAERLAAFWFPDEVVLYVGLAGPRKTRPPGGELAHRVSEYFQTPLGARSPHAGGWPLKTLVCLSDLYVHYAYCDAVDDAEKLCIGRFADHVSAATLARLHDRERVIPFANLEFPKGNPKAHGIRGARAPRKPKADETAKGSPARLTVKSPRPPTRASEPRRSSVTPHHRSQNVTEKDIKVGQVRIPRGAPKAILPLDRQDIAVQLHGRELTCRWDPRYGPPERSGVIRVGKAAATELLTAGDTLAVSVDDANVVGLD